MEGAALIGVDTNVLLRFVLRDDAEQSALARDFLAGRTPRDPAYVSLLVLCEFAWVLTRNYRRPRADIAKLVTLLLNTPSLWFERPEVAQRALDAYVVSRADFGDCCIASLAVEAGCQHSVTFDKAAAKLPGMRLLTGSEA